MDRTLVIILLLVVCFLPMSLIPGNTDDRTPIRIIMDTIGITGGSSILPGGDNEYRGNINFIENEVDFLSGAAASPTSAAYNLFHVEPYSGLSGIALTNTGTTTEVYPEDNGYVWMSIYGGTDFYIVEDAFITANPRVKQHYWKDYDGDGDEDFVIKLYIGDIAPIGTAQTPTCTLSLPLLDEDVASYSDDNPSDISSIGTSEVVQAVTWKLSGITAEDGSFLTRLYFGTNDTRGGDDVRFEELSLSGGWVASSGARTYYGSPVKEDNGDYEAWYINPADYLEYHQGERIWRDTNDADTLYITVNVRCTMETSDVVTVTLYADFLDPDGSSITSVSDAVNLSA